ncbi:hypothetical protein ACF0H5_014068 [Mactra antiquata]
MWMIISQKSLIKLHNNPLTDGFQSNCANYGSLMYHSSSDRSLILRLYKRRHALTDMTQEFNGDTWPGQPKALKGREVRVGGTSVANFTWKVPYDASYRALDGFILMITMIENSVPRNLCFFANLSGTVWKNVVDPYSVLFHFDCVKSRGALSVDLTLKSSPVPVHTSDNITVGASLSFSDSQPLKRNFSIKTEITDLDIHVTFGPVDVYAEHVVCLLKLDTVVNYLPLVCFRNLVVPKVKTSDEQFFVSKSFNVTANVPKEDNLSHLTILSITMTCLVLVTVITTCYFCIIRKHRSKLDILAGGISSGCRICDCQSIYQKPSYVPNNAADEDKDAIVEILPVYYSESESFKSAVHECCLYLSKWGECEMKFDWMNENNPTILSQRTEKPSYIALLFLSSKMLVNFDDIILKTNTTHYNDPLTPKFRGVYANAMTKVVVALQPVQESISVVKDKLELTKKDISNQNQLEMNTGELHELLRMLKMDRSIENGWCQPSELSRLLNAIRLVPPTDLNIGWNQSGNDTLYSRKTSPETEYLHSEDLNIGGVPYCTVCKRSRHTNVPLTQKEDDILNWTKSVNQFTSLHCPNNCLKSINGTYVSTPRCFQGDQLHPDDEEPYESAIVYQNGVLDNEHLPHPSSDGWDPPDSDIESVSYSVMGQRFDEINRNYRASFGE